MTTIFADGGDDSGRGYGARPQAGTVSRQMPEGRHHKHRKRRSRLTLLDFPDTGGMPREIVSGHPGLRVRPKVVLAITASAALAVSGLFGAKAFLRSSGTPLAAQLRVPLVPFPTAAASSPSSSSQPPPLAITLQGSQLSPSQVAAQATPALTSPASRPTPLAAASSTASPAGTIIVNYSVVSSWNGGFEGEVQVTNDESAPIQDWQITIALPHDQITSFSGANGYVSNHILLLEPATGTGALAAGSELSVFFVAEGTQQTPELCAFNNISCG